MQCKLYLRVTIVWDSLWGARDAADDLCVNRADARVDYDEESSGRTRTVTATVTEAAG